MSNIVIGIGASAGGLKALEQLFKKMPANTGYTFVVVQHLSPDFKSLMEDILSRHTEMRVLRVEEGMKMQSNCVYLIPPNKLMTMDKNRHFHLTKRGTDITDNMPINVFFESMALCEKDNAVGIVLSGTGSDGTEGIRVIKKHNGLAIAQSIESAEFDGMPRNAIATQLVDYITSPEKIASTLISHLDRKVSLDLGLITNDKNVESALEAIFRMLQDHIGIDFSDYKENSVSRRISRRVSMQQLDTLEEYVEYIKNNEDEIDLLYRDLLIGVTEFFRDPEVFKYLEEKLMVDILRNAGPECRIWVAGYATGEEAYSIAILSEEAAQKINYDGRISIFATDMHKGSLAIAAAGEYDKDQLQKIKPEYIDRYFTASRMNPNGYKVNQMIRNRVVFAPHNLVSDPPFTKIDFVTCRNLLIYMKPVLQEKALSIFHYCLKTKAHLLLGSS